MLILLYYTYCQCDHDYNKDTSLWLADDQSRDTNNALWLAGCYLLTVAITTIEMMAATAKVPKMILRVSLFNPDHFSLALSNITPP